MTSFRSDEFAVTVPDVAKLLRLDRGIEKLTGGGDLGEDSLWRPVTFACRGSSLLVVGAQIGETGNGDLWSVEKPCSSKGAPIGGERERADVFNIDGSNLRSRSLRGGVRGGRGSDGEIGEMRGVGEPPVGLEKSWSILRLFLPLRSNNLCFRRCRRRSNINRDRATRATAEQTPMATLAPVDNLPVMLEAASPAEGPTTEVGVAVAWIVD